MFKTKDDCKDYIYGVVYVHLVSKNIDTQIFSLDFKKMFSEKDTKEIMAILGAKEFRKTLDGAIKSIGEEITQADIKILPVVGNKEQN